MQRKTKTSKTSKTSKTKTKPKPKPGAKLLYRVVAQEWEESERGWGTRPEGYTLYTTKERYEKHIADDISKKQATNAVPDSYVRTVGPANFDYFVGAKTYDDILHLEKKGMRFWGYENHLPKNGTLP